MKEVIIYAEDSAEPDIYKNILRTYTEFGLYCMEEAETGVIYRYPIARIMRIGEISV